MPLNTLSHEKLDELMRYFFEHQMVGMAISSANKEWVGANEKLTHMLGYTFDELKTMTWAQITHPEDLMLDVAKFGEIVSGKIDSYELEKRYIHKNGAIIYAHLAISSIRNSEGAIDYVIAFVEDVTERTLEEARRIQAMDRKEAEHRTLLDNLPDNVARWDTQGRYLYINPVHEHTLGIKASQLLGTSIMELKNRDNEVVRAIKQIIATGEDTITVFQPIVVGGEAQIHEVKLLAEKDADGNVVGILGVGRDVTERKRAEDILIQKEAMFRTLAENSPNVIIRYDKNGNRLYVNPAYKKQVGIPEDVAINSSPTKDWGGYFKNTSKSAEEFQGEILKAIETGKPAYLFIDWVRVSDDAYVAYDYNIIPERNAEGEIIGALAIGHDITERKTTQERIQHIANHDALTTLPNRTLAKTRAQEIIAQAKKSGEKVAVFFIDLDGFKAVNDTLGHSTGDALLQKVAKRLLKSTRTDDLLSRQGGDEFILIASELHELRHVQALAEKLLKGFAKPFEIGHHTISISASIGIALYPDHGESFDALLQHADSAMYQAKETGKNTFCLYTHAMKHITEGQFEIQNDLSGALLKGEFELHYQPQIDLETNQVIGAEALIRWRHPSLGLLMPMKFIPIAENTGQIVQIGDWVLLEACIQAAAWHAMGKKITVAVNISAIQFRRGNLLERVVHALSVSRLEPEYLELELTESILIHNTEMVLSTVQAIKKMGIRLSIDDFGTGYSSLSYLKRFPVDKLKIDQSFVHDIAHDHEDAMMVQTIIAMAKSFNLKSIAEGVETKESLELIRSFGCDEVQGYYFAKPLDAAAFEKFISL